MDAVRLRVDVLADAVMAWRLLRPGGLLVFDDANSDRRVLPHAPFAAQRERMRPLRRKGSKVCAISPPDAHAQSLPCSEPFLL